MILLELVLYCLLFFLLVKGAVRNSGRNCLYFYSKEYLDAGKTDKAHAALRSGSEILAGTCVDILENPELLQKIKEEFQERKKKEQLMK